MLPPAVAFWISVYVAREFITANSSKDNRQTNNPAGYTEKKVVRHLSILKQLQLNYLKIILIKILICSDEYLLCLVCYLIFGGSLKNTKVRRFISLKREKVFFF